MHFVLSRGGLEVVVVLCHESDQAEEGELISRFEDDPVFHREWVTCSKVSQLKVVALSTI